MLCVTESEAASQSSYTLQSFESVLIRPLVEQQLAHRLHAVSYY
jgi:hypothetical protein